jgi:lipopolysaccharide assembly protein A
MKKQRKNKLPGASNAIYTTILIIRYLLWALLVVTGLAIISLNANSVSLHYFWNTVSLPLSLLLLCSFTLGWLMGIGLGLINHIKLSLQNRQLQTRCERMESEVTRLKKDFSPDIVEDLYLAHFQPTISAKHAKK